MIASNKIIGSVTVVAVFWYGVGMVVALMRGTAPYDFFVYSAQSLAIVFTGALLGGGFTLGMGTALGASEESTLRLGASAQGATVSLGELPAPVQMARRALPAGLLEDQPWWRHVADQSPAFASAIRAVLEVMNAEPRLPASPHPGGHAGRTLIEHSLAVVPFMLEHAAAWLYEGQLDKRGHVRVRLQGDTPHRFRREDAPLLILAAIAHDIGKMTCYRPQDASKQAPGSRTLLVDEVRPNHDHEGARVLRRIPEVMSLPIEDRTALITAVGYYHHPFGLPASAAWLTDRMRSLTELLAIADIATGTAEGHTLTSSVEDEVDEEDGPITTVIAPELTASDLGADDEFVADFAGLQALAESSPSKSKSTATKASAPAFKLDPEISLFMEAIRKRGAVNGNVVGMRFAFKKGALVFVDESKMRRILRNQTEATSATLAQSMSDDPNGAAFTRLLLDQLDALDAVVKEHDGAELVANRALFRVSVDGMKGSQNSYNYVMFVVDAAIIPGIDALQDWEGEIHIIKPLWGQVRKTKPLRAEANSAVCPPPEPNASSEPVIAAGDVESDGSDHLDDVPPGIFAALLAEAGDGLQDDSELPEADDDDELPPPPPSVPFEPNDQSTSTLVAEEPLADVLVEDAGLSQESPAAEAPEGSMEVARSVSVDHAVDTSVFERGVHDGQDSVQPQAPKAASGEAPDTEIIDAHRILSDTIATPEFQQRFPPFTVRRGDEWYATYPVDSPAGDRLKAALDHMDKQLAGSGGSLDRSGIKVAKVRENQTTSYIIRLHSVPAAQD